LLFSILYVESNNQTKYSISDAICCVLAQERSKEVIDAVLSYYLPKYEKLAGDYTFPTQQPDYTFSSEDEMISYFVSNEEEATFFWNQYDNNPDKIMVGAFFATDKYLIISLTVRLHEKKELDYLTELKHILGSEIGTINSVDPPEFIDGRDFISRYSLNR
jgi:hypothetical protein